MADKEKNQEKLQAKFVEFKQLKEQIEQLEEHIKHASGQLEQISKVMGNLHEIESLDDDTEILVPVTNGVFIKARTTDTKKFIVNIGAETAVERDLKGIEALLISQQKELSEVHARMNIDLDTTRERAIALQNELKSMME